MKQPNGVSCLKIILFIVLVFCAGIIVASCASPEEPAVTQFPSPTNVPTPTNTLLPTEPFETREPTIERFNFIILGGDFRESRENTGFGDKTDVMIVVSILMSDPVQITLIQLPRNLYVPVENMPDLWAFAVYRQEGFAGIHYWFQEVFDLTVQGIAYTDMDNFVRFVDDVLGGMSVGGDWRDGESVLEYVRNDLWGVQYDPEKRHFAVLLAIANKLILRFTDDGLTTAQELWEFRDLIETDISSFGQFHWIIETAYNILQKGYDINFVQLQEPIIIYGDTPTYPGRGFIANADLAKWMRMTLGNVIY